MDTIPAPKGRKYLPFQEDGIRYLAIHKNVLLCDSMGLGKSIEAIGLINYDPNIKDVLVICPASLKINWKQELNRWLVGLTSIEIASASKPFPSSNVIIMNYDILHKFKVELRSKVWNLVVVDECHMAKSKDARRSQQIFGKKKFRCSKQWDLYPILSERKVLMTGTPIENKPQDLWPLLNYLDPRQWPTMSKFTDRYCDGHPGHFSRWEISGAKNLPELREKLRSTLMLRRLKEEVLPDLPPKLRQVIELPQNGATDLVELENNAYSSFEQLTRELQVATELAKVSEDKADYKAAVSRLADSVRMAWSELAIARKKTAVAKIPYILAHLECVSAEKVVIWIHHREVAKKLKEKLGKDAVMLIGGMSDKAKNEAVNSFQTDPTIKYFIGSIMAAGVGLTLTASSHCIFAELDWKPSSIAQCEDRQHRISQLSSVLIQHLVFSGSIDSKMSKLIIAKQEMIDEALDNNVEPASTHATWEQITNEATGVIHETVESIHSALRYLANLNGDITNPYDREIIRSLANETQLSDKQAVLGRKILRRYKKQLSNEVVEAITD